MAAASCATPTSLDPAGAWGGPEASLVLTAEGGTMTSRCGTGTIAAGWTLSANGDLDAPGQYFAGGGPLPPTGRPPRPARYTGQFQGDHLTLSIFLGDENLILGPYQLERNGPAVQEVCQ